MAPLFAVRALSVASPTGQAVGTVVVRAAAMIPSARPAACSAAMAALSSPSTRSVTNAEGSVMRTGAWAIPMAGARSRRLRADNFFMDRSTQHGPGWFQPAPQCRPLRPSAMRALTVLFLVCGLSCTPADPAPTGDAPAPDPTITPAMTFHDLSATDIHGVPVQMSRFKGHKVLVVNTASECGYTPQYAQLEELYRTYKDKGLVVVGFPSNSVGGQEPGSADEIVAFCERNYGVTFPLMEKVQISRNDPHPVY